MLVRALCNQGKAMFRQQLALQVSRRMAHDVYGGSEYPPGLEPAVLDEFPIPQGSWEESYAGYQKKYNKQLAAAIGFMTFTLVYVYNSGVVDLVLAPPMKNPPNIDPTKHM